MTLTVLSYGGGVQSTAMLVMGFNGDLPLPDHAIFADTGWEGRRVYEVVKMMQDECRKHGVQFHVVKGGHIKEDALRSQVKGVAEDGNRWASMPYFTRDPDGNHGMVRRQCTSEYKIKPIQQKIREIMGFKKGERVTKDWFDDPVQHQYGISVDEYQRARLNRSAWEDNVYPLIDRKISRTGCIKYLQEHGYNDVPKSSCVSCPYRSDASWRGLKNDNPEEWEDVTSFDEKIRSCGGMRSDIFLHSSRKPLKEVDFRNDTDRGQGLLFGRTDCTGPCGT